MNNILLAYNYKFLYGKIPSISTINSMIEHITIKNNIVVPYLYVVDNKKIINKKYVEAVDGKIIVEICVDEIFSPTREWIEYYCVNVFNIKSEEIYKHPGTKYITELFTSDSTIISGKITYIDENFINSLIPHSKFEISNNEYVFQSRNPPHCAHEQILKNFHKKGMLYTTPYSTAKQSDYKFSDKIKTYELMKTLYGVDVFVSTLPRIFAGPIEALQNCLLFQKLGYKKFIMGRGKNCVGDFYGETESYDFCKAMYNCSMLEIEPIWQETIYSYDVEIKGSTIKSMYIDKNIFPPENLMNRKVSEILLDKQCLEN